MDLNPAWKVLCSDSIALVGGPRSVERRAALMLGESIDPGRVVGSPEAIRLKRQD